MITLDSMIFEDNIQVSLEDGVWTEQGMFTMFTAFTKQCQQMES